LSFFLELSLKESEHDRIKFPYINAICCTQFQGSKPIRELLIIKCELFVLRMKTFFVTFTFIEEYTVFWVVTPCSLDRTPTFWWNTLLPTSSLKSKPHKKTAEAENKLSLLGLLFDLDDGDSMFL
jgi:hypothetical protein